MSEQEEQEDTTLGWAYGALANLLAPLRLPERVLEALDELVEAVRYLGPVHSELTHIREKVEPLPELLAALDRVNEGLGGRLDSLLEVVRALESERSHLNLTVRGMYSRVDALHEDLSPVDNRLATLERTTKELAEAVEAIRNDVVGIKDDIQRVTGLRGERGKLERARDKLTGGDTSPAEGRPESPR